MRFSPRTWSLISALLFAGAIFFWMKGDEVVARRRQAQPPAPATNKATSAASPRVPLPLLTSMADAAVADASQGNAFVSNKFPFRLANTRKPWDALAQSDTALLLGNAFIDSAEKTPLKIPAHLKAGDDAVGYIVQARGAMGSEFRKLLREAGAEIVSYVPNNAYLVAVGADGAERLRQARAVQTVMPFEPYFKLDDSLLAAAVQQTPLNSDTYLRVTVFPSRRDAAVEELRTLGAETLGEETSPFGPQFVVRTAPDGLADLARLVSVQAVEPVRLRAAANDMTRVQLGISEDTITNATYLDLTGTNVWININDSGIDEKHPDLKDRVFSPFATMKTDTNGHGTFVAATLVGSGVSSATDASKIRLSETNADFRGMAPQASLFALPLDFSPGVNISLSDTYIQETAARTNYLTLGRTNTLISNNSWVYAGASEYDSAAARYDAAVRDAIPGAIGSQAVLYVFPAGNSGFGNDEGRGGEADTVFSPGTAKNVITVGAIEHLRAITNSIMVTNVVDQDGETVTNITEVFPLAGITDSDTEVASFSSRGNVGIGTEGRFGRFKPDLVAPGTFLVSARAADYKVEDHFDTNVVEAELLKELDDGLTEYRYDSGTSYAVPAVSGMLALMQEFFGQRIPAASGPTRDLSPALMKALLINGARSVNPLYDLNVRSTINYQGWGLPSIQRSIPALLKTNAEAQWPILLIEQSATNALATGESQTWNITVSSNALYSPIRFTLVWTDPPGNPNVAVKLVNDLDLEVRCLDTGEVFYGNNFAAGSDFTEFSHATNAPIRDFVNNVENVIIGSPVDFGARYSVSIKARRVNVNSVHEYAEATKRTNDVVQDFALVISADNMVLTNTFEQFELATPRAAAETRAAVNVTNGIPIFNQRIGANPSLVGTNGLANQWNFYVFTNSINSLGAELASITNGSNVAFVTFSPPNLSTPRPFEADVDLYVSTDPALLVLAPKAIAGALKSVTRDGTEYVVLTNAPLGQVYYIGVKAEDQKGAEFSLMTVSSNFPFEEQDDRGRKILHGVPLSEFLPDGSPNLPSGTVMLAIGLSNRRVQRATVEDVISHENLGDLFGELTHNRQFSVLNNHTLNDGLFSGTNRFIYDDSGRPNTPEFKLAQRTDGPGSLNNFVGEKLVGPWFLHMIDNSPTHTGRVEALTITIEPLPNNLLPGVAVQGSADALSFTYYPIDVPAGATNMIVNLRPDNPSLPLDLYLKRGELPALTNYDAVGIRVAGGGTQLIIGIDSTPPLVPGTYYLGVYNPNLTKADYSVIMFLEYGINGETAATLNGGPMSLLDNATTNSVIEVRQDKVVTGAEVGLRLDDPRIADLSIHLVSPQGSRLLLSEMRGGTNATAFGASFPPTNRVTTTYALFTERTNLARIPIKFTAPPFGDKSTNVGQAFTNDFEAVTARNYDQGETFDGWTADTNVTSVVYDSRVAHKGDLGAVTGGAYSDTTFMVVANGAVSRMLETKPGRSYRLLFKSKANPYATLYNTGVDSLGRAVTNQIAEPHYTAVETAQSNILGTAVFTPLPSNPLFPSFWLTNTTNSQWISIASGSAANAAGRYVFRTLFGLHGYEVPTASLAGGWAADERGLDILLNGVSLGFTAAGPKALAPFNIPLGAKFVQGINTLDFVITNSSGFLGLRTDMQLSRGLILGTATNILPNAFLSLANDFTYNQVGRDQWKTSFIDFIGADDPAGTLLKIWADLPGMAFDDFELVDTGVAYLQPEESFEPLNGQRAVGEWRLEITDDRTGAVVNPNPFLFSWFLNLEFAQPTPPAEELLHGKPYPATVNTVTNVPNFFPGTLRLDEVQYFILETCPNETKATVTLVGEAAQNGKLILMADQSGLPTGNALTDDYTQLVDTNSNSTASLELTLKTPAPAPLRPGKRFFVAVKNVFPDETNTFSIRVDYDNPGCKPGAPKPFKVNSLVASAIAAAGVGTGESFSFEVSEATVSATIQVESSGADLGILVGKGSVPTPENYLYAQDRAGVGPEAILLTRDSAPEPLSAGPWFVTIYNNSPDPASYTIQLTETTAQVGPRLSAVYAGGRLTLSWVSNVGSQYRVESSKDLRAWNSLGVVTASDTNASYTDTASPQNEAARFYRIVRLQ